MSVAPTPYCGAPPDPGAIWTSWRLDPVVLTLLGLLLVAYVLGARRGRLESGRRRAFYAGWTVASLALVSPLCPLSVSLFSARVAQHLALELIAAPLVAYGRPWRAYAALVSSRAGQRPGAPPRPLLSAGVFAVALWYWHAPGPYDLTFESTAIYWTMHLTAFGAALLLWSGLEDGLTRAAPAAIAASILSSAQMTFLGALITLSPRALYSPHALTTAAWGVSQLDDQQIGGLVMWVPGCLLFLGLGLLGLGRALQRAGAADAAHA